MEIIGKRGNPFADMFAKGEYAGPNFLYAGVFYNRVEKYQKMLARILYKIKVEDPTAEEDFYRFIKELDYEVEGEALYPREDVVNWQRPFKVFGNSEAVRFPRRSSEDVVKVKELVVAPASAMEHSSGLVFLRLIGYEDESLTAKLKWQLRKEVADVWHSLSEDAWVKDYLEKAQEVLNLIEKSVGDENYFKHPFSRIAFYIIPVNFDKFHNGVIISSVSVFYRKKETREKLWEKFLEDLTDVQREDLIYGLGKVDKGLDHLKEFMELALSQDTLNRLRKDWKVILEKLVRGESRKILGVFVGNPKSTRMKFSYGDIILPVKKIELACFAEKNFVIEKKTKNGVVKFSLPALLKGFEGNLKEGARSNVKQYIGELEISLKLDEGGKPFSLDSLFNMPNFCYRYLQDNIRVNNGSYSPQDSLKVLYALLSFGVKLTNFVQNKEPDKLTAGLFILDTELAEENGKYPLWNEVRTLYEGYGYPMQTITRRFFRSLGKKPAPPIKNMIISLGKNIKIVEFDFDGFSLPERFTIYAILESPSSQFFCKKDAFGEQAETEGQRHYLFYVYQIDIQNGRAKVFLNNMYDALMENYGGNTVVFEKWVEEQARNEHVKFFFITSAKKSLLFRIAEKIRQITEKDKSERKLISVRYEELKTAYISKKAQSSCYILYTHTTEKLQEMLGIKPERELASVALKPAHANNPYDKEFYHASLQLFFTERVGWLDDEQYERERDMFLLTLLSLSIYGSESFSTPYAKLSLQTTERTRYLKLPRDMKHYLVPIRPALQELLYIISFLPGAQEARE